jgi:para-aminobenzoate synthetase/4-amino-4-deoxychorismate lyase
MKPLSDDTILRLTSRLDQEDDFVFLETAKVTEENHRSLLFTQPCGHLSCMPGDDVTAFLDQADQLREQGRFLAGWLAYEFAYQLEPCLRRFISPNIPPNSFRAEKSVAMLGIYDEPIVFDHKTGQFSSGEKWPVGEGQQASFNCSQLETTVSKQQYLEAIRTIQEYILAGDTYQVNFTLHCNFNFQGSVAALYRALRRNQSVSYSAWIRHKGHDILSFSPELFFASDSGKVRVRPMKGTMARGRTTSEDEELKLKLRSDPKNRSENVMIVDLLRNDLGRLLHEAGGGAVIPQSLFDVEKYESLLQMTSTIDGVAEQGASLSFRRLTEALFPCGSVTGAPKIRTMEIIHELERRPRGVYCGAIGYTSREASCFNVPIRTLELNNGRGRMGIGSGVVADSVPEAEWEECLLKGHFLTKNEPDFQLIETLLLQRDKFFFLLDFHLDRLEDSARYFHFSYDAEFVRLRLEEEIRNIQKGEKNDICRKSQRRWRVRLLLRRDGGIETSSAPLIEEKRSEAPMKVFFSKQQVESSNPYLFHKTTRRDLYNKEFSRASERGYYEVLFTNTAGEITEGAVSNIFLLRKNETVFLTPPVECGLLAGTYRRMLLEQGRVVERVLTVDDVMSAQEVYVANSVRGLVRVRPAAAGIPESAESS